MEALLFNGWCWREADIGQKLIAFDKSGRIHTSAVRDRSVWNPEIHWRSSHENNNIERSRNRGRRPCRVDGHGDSGACAAGAILRPFGPMDRLRRYRAFGRIARTAACRATYQVDGSGMRLRQTLRCASDSYKFELSSDVVSDGARLSGTWSESSRGISGTLQGHANGDRISAVADAPGFSANLNLTTRGNRQSVSIVSQGDIRDVSITMVRG
jgi:hypothetical protein